MGSLLGAARIHDDVAFTAMFSTLNALEGIYVVNHALEPFVVGAADDALTDR